MTKPVLTRGSAPAATLFEGTVTVVSTAVWVLIDGTDQEAQVDYAPPYADWAVNDRVACTMTGRKLTIVARLGASTVPPTAPTTAQNFKAAYQLTSNQSGPGSANTYQTIINWVSTELVADVAQPMVSGTGRFTAPYTDIFTVSLAAVYTAGSVGQFGLRIRDVTASTTSAEAQPNYANSFAGPMLLTAAPRLISGHAYSFDVETPVGGKTIASGTWLTIQRMLDAALVAA